jgi:hypothetical protein
MTMPKQFENPVETKVEDDTVLNETPKESTDHLVEEAAVKSTKREQKYDKNHKLFTI